MKTSLSSSGKEVLIYYIELANHLGGSDYLPLLLIAELQKRGYHVTLVLDFKADLERASKLYNVFFDIQKVRMISIKPMQPLIRKLDAYIPFCRVRRMKKLVKQADICISASNMFDFGKPAHHVVFLINFFGDNAFHNFIMHRKPLTGLPLFKQKFRTFFAETFLRPILGVRSTRRIIADPREHIYVPSQYVANTMQAFYGQFNCTLFYPPTIFEIPQMNVKRHPERVIYLGRIHPDKRIQDIIEIVERTRELSGLPLELYFAGNLKNNAYAEGIQKQTADKSWVQFVGPVYEKEKAAFLLSGTYAIHAERDEAFGISITEYLKAGCIPIVPDEGGTPEIVGNPALTYHTNEDAAKILTHLLSDEAFRQEQLNRCRERAKEYSFERYMETQHKILDKILGEPF